MTLKVIIGSEIHSIESGATPLAEQFISFLERENILTVWRSNFKGDIKQISFCYRHIEKDGDDWKNANDWCEKKRYKLFNFRKDW